MIHCLIESDKPILIVTEYDLSDADVQKLERDYDTPYDNSYLSQMADRDKSRLLFMDDFPYTILIRGFYPCHDIVEKWCWKNFGNQHCIVCTNHNAEYPGCPLVLATEHVAADGDIEYSKVEPHGHTGRWTAQWLLKTGYDFGYSELYFETELMKNRLISVMSDFNNFPDMERFL